VGCAAALLPRLRTGHNEIAEDGMAIARLLASLTFRDKEQRQMGNVQDVSDATFDAEVLQSSTPVLIDFWAPWCGPCRAIAPIVDELAKEYEGKLKVVKMNVDDNQTTPSRYGVRGIPNLIVFKGGKVHEQIVGAVPKSRLTQAVQSAVG
jgi:thioredoxin 1